MAGGPISPHDRGGPTALLTLLDGLVDRMLRSPLMRRAPAQCGPEQQAAQAALLAAIVNVRSLRAASESLPALPQVVVAQYWPELAAILAASRRPGVARARAAGAPRLAATLGGLYDSRDAEQAEEGLPAGENAAQSLAAPGGGSGDEGRSRRLEELVRLLKEALKALDKPQNTTQLLAWLRERGDGAGREEVMHALFAREDLFRKRGAGQWTLVGHEPRPPASPSGGGR